MKHIIQFSKDYPNIFQGDAAFKKCNNNICIYAYKYKVKDNNKEWLFIKEEEQIIAYWNKNLRELFQEKTEISKKIKIEIEVKTIE